MAAKRSVHVLGLAKVQAALFALLGVVAGVVYAVGGLALDALVSIGWTTSTETSGVGVGTALALLAIVGMPLLFGAAGYVLGIVEAALYNASLRWWGGVGLDLRAR